MISVEEAQALILRHAKRLGKVQLKIVEALGCVTAAPLLSAVDFPVGDNSAMDGFVFRARDVTKASSQRPVLLKKAGVIQAGDTQRRLLESGQIFSIMTGAFMPVGGDTVLAKEDAVWDGNCLCFTAPPQAGRHVRKRGEELRRGTRILGAGEVMHPATVSLYAMNGQAEATVYPKPRVAVLVTGSELVSPGTRLKYGQIYDSNSSMLVSLCRVSGADVCSVASVRDRPESLRKKLLTALASADAVLISGGVSVGDYDYVKLILKNLRVKQVFWRIKQKPGKPLFFGTKGRRLVFGLPGNPASVFTCFYEYVYPALRRMAGFQETFLTQEMLRVQTDLKPDQEKTQFLKAKTVRNAKGIGVIPLGRQGSHMISSLHAADGFIRVSPSRRMIKKGQKVPVDLLPVR